MKYRKKPVVVKAVRWMGDNIHEVYNLTNGSAYKDDGEIVIKDIRGDRRVLEHDYIVLDGDSGFQVMSAYTFDRTYEPA